LGLRHQELESSEHTFALRFTFTSNQSMQLTPKAFASRLATRHVTTLTSDLCSLIMLAPGSRS
jgi:hypothetical protein